MRILFLVVLLMAGCVGPNCLHGHDVVDAPPGYRYDCGFHTTMDGDLSPGCGFGYFYAEQTHWECDKYESTNTTLEPT